MVPDQTPSEQKPQVPPLRYAPIGMTIRWVTEQIPSTELASRPEEVMGLRPTQGDEKRLVFSNYPPWKHHPSLCHLDRSAAQWRDLCVDALSWKCFRPDRCEVEATAVCYS
jgi:hypothetical protein